MSRLGSRFEAIRRKLPALMLAIFLSHSFALADEGLWDKLKQGGYVVLIRHAATVPGTGDPPGFKIDDCRTQRNLSDAGRAEARSLGEAFRSHGIPVSEVRSSQWCRCLETAKLAFGHAHRVEPWSGLNSLFNDSSREAAQTRAVYALAETVKPPTNLVLVTHNFNIRALAGVSPATAEVIVTRSEGGGLQLVGRIPAP